MVPPGFEAPRRVEPQGATWSASQSLLRWQLGAAAVPPGAAGSLVAAFRVKAGSEAAAAGIKACRAMLVLRGEGETAGGILSTCVTSVSLWAWFDSMPDLQDGLACCHCMQFGEWF
jgi:hypothetical protein